MEKQVIHIPSGNRYLSNLKDENGNKIDFQLPDGILNKQLTGCGGTTLALESEEKTIICSPRKKLLENKHLQYPNTLLVKGGIFGNEIKEYLATTDIPKILVTYDSFYKLVSCIEDIDNWKIVIDEFQCLLTDSTFKSDTEIKLLKDLKRFKHITYMSATPILDKYLEELHFFDDVPYYSLEWEDIELVSVYREKTANPIGAAIDIVRHYQTGNYPFMRNLDGTITYSKEAVIFLNSVTNIVNIIKKTELKPEQVNIIIGDNEENDNLLKKLGEGFVNGNAPLKGEKHKMITFCTSTAYMGVDFYSTNASTFVISDCKRVNTAVDIATELAQIAGRQRLDTNPFRNKIQFIFNTSALDVSADDFLASIQNKVRVTELEVEDNNKASVELKSKRIKDNIRNRKIFGYEDSYTMYNEETKQFEFNRLAYISEVYMFEVQRFNFQNGIFVRKLMKDTGKFDVSEGQEYAVYEEKLKCMIAKQSFEEQMKRYCEHRTNTDLSFNLLADSEANSNPKLKAYFDALGADRIKALSYKESNLKNEIRLMDKGGNIIYEVGKVFKSGDRLTKPVIKARLQAIYDSLGLKKKATATQISQYGFTTKEVKIDVDGKRVNGFELIR